MNAVLPRSLAVPSLAVLGLALSLARAADPGAIPPSQEAYRIPTVAVPFAPRPQIDGIIRKGDWVVAARLHDFVPFATEETGGFAAPEPTEVWISYSDEALHVGFRMHLEEGCVPSAAVASGHDAGQNDDAFEIFLAPKDGKEGGLFHLGGNAAGVSWDRRLEKTALDWEWNPKVEYKVTVEPGKHWWMGEWVIPFKELGVPPPKEGEVWRANFVSNRRTPLHRLDTWSFWKKWQDHPNNGRLVFGGRRPFFSMTRQTAEAWKGEGTNPSVFAPTNTVENPARVSYAVELWRKREMGGVSFLKDLQARRDQATGEGATFASLQKDVADTLAGYERKQDFALVRPVPPKDWTGPWGGSVKVEEPGDYLLVYAVNDLSDPKAPRMVAEGAVPFRIRVGIQAAVWPYLLTRSSVVLAGDLRAVPDLKAVAKLRGVITPVGGKGDLAEATVPCKGEKSQSVEVPVGKVPDGPAYEARLQALDAGGKVLSEAVTAFRKPPPPDWWANRAKYGVEPEVPWPWTPVAWKDRRASVWGREIEFGDGALPRQIVNRGAPILAAPIALELKAGGKAVEGKTSLRVLEQRPGHVLLESVREAAGVRVTARTRLEFDGFSTVDLAIEPVAGEAALEGLDLVIPVKKEFAAFLTNYMMAPGPGTPPKEKRYVGPTPAEYASPPMITTWLGTDDGGLEWSCESSKGWYLAKPNRAIEVRKGPAAVEARFHLVDSPMKLRQRREIRFGLVATPVKPQPAERVNWRIERIGYPPPLVGKSKVKGGTVATEQDRAEWERFFKGSKALCMLMAATWTGPHNTFWHPVAKDPETIEVVRAQGKVFREHGTYGLWNGGWAIAPYAEEWDPWGKEMVAWPITPTFANQFNGTYTSPFTEFMVGSFAKNVQLLGIQGIRFDTVFPWLVSANPWLGETWTSDVPGAETAAYGTQALFRQREMLMRLYRIFNPGGKEPAGLIYAGMAGPPLMMLESFVDIHEIGEGHYMHAPSLKVGYGQEMGRLWFTDKAYGFVAVNNPKGAPLTASKRMGALLVMGARPHGSARMNEDAYECRHPEFMPMKRFWEAMEWIDRSTAEWLPHWNNRGAMRTSAPGEHYGSLYLQRGKRALVIVSNYEQAPTEIVAALDRKALGFPADAALEAKDAVTGEPVPIENGTLRLRAGAELWRMVRVAPKGAL